MPPASLSTLPPRTPPRDPLPPRHPRPPIPLAHNTYLPYTLAGPTAAQLPAITCFPHALPLTTTPPIARRADGTADLRDAHAHGGAAAGAGPHQDPAEQTIGEPAERAGTGRYGRSS
ncbi:hypothetical protein B7494_g7796 [Chlorociboria aeruginascens]|nr:hypothetical protein B7494_g7796 [Chlorociboria aeruginascens]